MNPPADPTEAAGEAAPRALPSVLSHVRAVAVPVAMALALALFLQQVNRHYPLTKWLFWRYAGYWLASLCFATGCLSTGRLVVRAVLGRDRALPILEDVVTSFAAGVYVFFLATSVAGLAGLLGAPLFFALPTLMVAVGIRPLAKDLASLGQKLRASAHHKTPRSWTSVLPWLFGLVGLAMVYVAVLTPENTAFDARWQHIALAEHYAAEGAMRRFPEGWYVGASPHLASVLYTWAFLLPRGALFDHVELAAHLEFTTFVFTLVGIEALFRLLVGSQRGLARHAWAARFLFPGVWLYDSSLCLGADHVAALFAAPIFALTVRAFRQMSPRLCLLLALVMSGAMLTKYTGALVLVGFPILALALRTLVLAVRALLKRPDPIAPRFWLGPLTAIGAGLVFTAPHWAKNLVFYGDPLYPLLSSRLHAHPWTPDSADRFQYGFIEAQLWRPTRDWKGLKESLGALFTFSFLPNDWPRFHGKVPVFGSLFTLGLGVLPFLRRARRVWALYAAVHLGVFGWYWTHHQDRYLQAIVPWMAAATAAVLALAWQEGRAAKVGVTALIAAQIVWGADTFFIPAHAHEGSVPKALSEFFAQGHKQNYEGRLDAFGSFQIIGRELPKGSKLLVHEEHPHAGLGVPTVNDYAVNQGGISYGRMLSPLDVDALYRGYGVTHILWPTKQGAMDDTLASDLVFFHYVTRFAEGTKTVGPLTLARMPSKPPPSERAPDPIAILSCKSGFSAGLYHLPDLHVPAFGPRASKFPRPYRPSNKDDAALVAAASAVAVEPGCSTMPPEHKESFTLVANRKPYELWIRTRGAAAP